MCAACVARASGHMSHGGATFHTCDDEGDGCSYLDSEDSDADDGGDDNLADATAQTGTHLQHEDPNSSTAQRAKLNVHISQHFPREVRRSV